MLVNLLFRMEYVDYLFFRKFVFRLLVIVLVSKVLLVFGGLYRSMFLGGLMFICRNNFGFLSGSLMIFLSL